MKILASDFDNTLLFHDQEKSYYRLEDVPNENKNIGLEEVIEGDGVTLIEWDKFIKEFIDYDLSLNIEILINEDNTRKFIIESKNNQYSMLFEELKND